MQIAPVAQQPAGYITVHVSCWMHIMCICMYAHYMHQTEATPEVAFTSSFICSVVTHALMDHSREHCGVTTAQTVSDVVFSSGLNWFKLRKRAWKWEAISSATALSASFVCSFSSAGTTSWLCGEEPTISVAPTIQMLPLYSGTDSHMTFVTVYQDLPDLLKLACCQLFVQLCIMHPALDKDVDFFASGKASFGFVCLESAIAAAGTSAPPAHCHTACCEMRGRYLTCHKQYYHGNKPALVRGCKCALPILQFQACSALYSAWCSVLKIRHCYAGIVQLHSLTIPYLLPIQNRIYKYKNHIYVCAYVKRSCITV